MKSLGYCILDKKDYKEEATMNTEEQKSEFNFHNNPNHANSLSIKDFTNCILNYNKNEMYFTTKEKLKIKDLDYLIDGTKLKKDHSLNDEAVYFFWSKVVTQMAEELSQELNNILIDNWSNNSKSIHIPKGIPAVPNEIVEKAKEKGWKIDFSDEESNCTISLL